MNTDTHRYYVGNPAASGFIRVYPCLSVVALSGLLLAGCADLRWHKDGADEAALERDLTECRQQGRMQAERQAVPPTTGGTRIVGVDRLGRPIIGQPEQLESNRAMVEHDLTRHCMSQRGYKLVSAEKP